MSNETGGEPRVIAAPITLVQKTVTRLDFDGTPKSKGGPGASGDLDLRIDTKRRPGVLNGSDAIEATLTVMSRPLGDSPFYSVNAEVRGLYEVSWDKVDGYEGADRFVRLRGMEELYDYFRLIMTIITTDGHYGQMVLPTIAVASID